MIFNSTTTWGWPAKILHWIGAAIILVLLVHGWWMTHMTPRPERLANYAWHSALGYDLLALTVLRLLWRWFNPVPELPADLKPWERVAARVGHVSLYVLMFIVSLTGWMVATTFRVPMTKDLLGVDVPAIVTTARCASGSRNRIWFLLTCLPRLCSFTSSERCVTICLNTTMFSDG